MKVIVENYSDTWSILFNKEEKAISKSLGTIYLSIDHIGSTSVKGLGAKPKIDILVGVKSSNDLNRVAPLMIESGYTYFRVYEDRMPNRRLFVKLQPLTRSEIPKLIDKGEKYIDGDVFKSTVHVHVMIHNSADWIRHIAFRDYLRKDEKTRDEYFELKKRLAEIEFEDGNDYNRHKDGFIKRVESIALAWYLDKKTQVHNVTAANNYNQWLGEM